MPHNKIGHMLVHHRKIFLFKKNSNEHQRMSVVFNSNFISIHKIS